MIIELNDYAFCLKRQYGHPLLKTASYLSSYFVKVHYKSELFSNLLLDGSSPIYQVNINNMAHDELYLDL